MPTQFTALAMMGGVDLDLTQARFAAREVTITAVAVMGGIDIIVPDGHHRDRQRLRLLGAFEDNAQVVGPPGGPVVRVNGLALMGGVEVKRPKAPKIRLEKRRCTRAVMRRKVAPLGCRRRIGALAVLGEHAGDLGLHEAGRALHRRVVGHAGAPPLDLLVALAARPRPEHVADGDTQSQGETSGGTSSSDARPAGRIATVFPIAVWRGRTRPLRVCAARPVPLFARFGSVGTFWAILVERSDCRGRRSSVAQLAEHPTVNRTVTGSSPVGGAKAQVR